MNCEILKLRDWLKLKPQLNNDMLYKCCDARDDAMKTDAGIITKNKAQLYKCIKTFMLFKQPENI